MRDARAMHDQTDEQVSDHESSIQTSDHDPNRWTSDERADKPATGQ